MISRSFIVWLREREREREREKGRDDRREESDDGILSDRRESVFIRTYIFFLKGTKETHENREQDSTETQLSN